MIFKCVLSYMTLPNANDRESERACYFSTSERALLPSVFAHIRNLSWC